MPRSTLTYTIYGYPSDGYCAFSSNIIDSNTKAQMCGLFSQSATPNYKNSSSYKLTANDIVIKFSDSSLGYSNAKILTEGTISGNTPFTVSLKILWSPIKKYD